MRLGGSVMKPYASPKEWLAHVKELGYSAVIFPVESTAPLSVLVHHALADGLHISKFYEAFDRHAAQLCKEE